MNGVELFATLSYFEGSDDCDAVLGAVEGFTEGSVDAVMLCAVESLLIGSGEGCTFGAIDLL